MNNRFFAILLTATLASSPMMLPAATKIWDGSANGNWSVGANWSGGTAPLSGDELVFPENFGARRNTTNNFLGGTAAFRWIRFDGNGYRIYGSVLALTDGIRAIGTGGGGLAGTNIINADVELRGSQEFRFFATGGPSLLEINGNIALGPHTLFVNNGSPGKVYLNGTISGSGGITKGGGYTLRLGGLFANTYTGPTYFTNGLLELSKGFFVGVVAVPGNLTVGSGTTGIVAIQSAFCTTIKSPTRPTSRSRTPACLI